uniref:Cyclin-dependent kinase 7 n=1 Tax=Hirondellea gigas TaxID=1518452 RepID=A0A2P2I2K8_9CRUS
MSGRIRVEEKLKRYEKIEFLGEGQFATVYKALDTETQNIVAVKKIKLGSREEARDGINRTALREVKLMQEVQHLNLLSLLDVFGYKSDVSLVFDFMDTDLEVIIKDTENIVLTPANIKSYLIQTLRGLEFLHHHWILHRDIKPNNLLVNCQGVLKVADFGLARFFGSPNRPYSHQVVTRWYRCPELLYGARQYGTGVDSWAVGCVLAELLIRCPYFPGESDLAQLTCIFTALGTPTDESWPNMDKLPDYVVFKPLEGSAMTDLFPAAKDDLIALLEGLLSINPLKRVTCTQALKMPYFSNGPAPTPGPLLPLPASVKQKMGGESSAAQATRALKRKIIDTSGLGGTLAKRLQF